MTANRFGGFWTIDKLKVLGAYLSFYSTALKRQPYSLVYIDAFAGTGRCHVRTRNGERQVVDGSATIALNCSPPFHSYRFIEKKHTHHAELATLISNHANGSRSKIAKGEAQDVLPAILGEYDWHKWRGVLFLDPFGLQVTWPLLQQVASTKALDVFFLVSLSGLYRQAAIHESGIDDGKAAKLTATLGTDAWREAMYSPPVQRDLFLAAETRTREPGWEALLQFTTLRLSTLFPYVGEPHLMTMHNGAPLFALYFAVCNPSGPALKLAARVSTEILSKLPR